MAGERVLIIEDHALNMELATDLLEASGYLVTQAIDAETGIEQARALQPALILMDIGLPRMDGFTAAKLLHDDRATAAIPVVILSAHAMKHDEERILSTGCVGYITKPIDTRSFIETVAGLIGRRRLIG